MAKHTITQLMDDLDGSEADESTEFAFRGKSYSIDLSAKTASEFDQSLAPYVSAAEQAGGVPASAPPAVAIPRVPAHAARRRPTPIPVLSGSGPRSRASQCRRVDVLTPTWSSSTRPPTADCPDAAHYDGHEAHA